MTPEEFIGEKVSYDRSGQMIFGHKKDKMQLLLDVRGWGAIQHLFKTEQEAADFQDTFGEWIANTINEKLNGNSIDKMVSERLREELATFYVTTTTSRKIEKWQIYDMIDAYLKTREK